MTGTYWPQTLVHSRPQLDTRLRAGHQDEDSAPILAQLGGNPETIAIVLAEAAGGAPAPAATGAQAPETAEAAERDARYRHIARALVLRLAIPLGLNAHGVEGFVVIDDEHGRYLAMSTDRARHQWRDAAFLHLHVADGHVTIEWNGTEEDVLAELIARGVRPEDVSRGWLRDEEGPSDEE